MISYKTSEDREQVIVVDWIHANGMHCFSVPNEAALRAAGKGRSAKFALISILKRMGLLPGAPDLVIINPTVDGLRVVLEMKRDAKSKVTDTQKVVHELMRGFEWIVVVGFSADDAIRKLGAFKWRK